MIIEVKEYTYMGIKLIRVPDQGWKCNLGGVAYLFPHCQAAHSAIHELYANVGDVVKKHKGKKITK